MGIFNGALTKSALKKVLKKKYITVDDTLAKTATLIKGGEIIKLNLPEIVSPKKKLVFPLSVLYEDEHLAVIYKPAGILVSGNHFQTIANALQQNIKASTLGDAATPQPVHRIDYPTTGVLLIGKTHSSIRALNKMFEDQDIMKTYFAVVIGEISENGKITSTIDGKKAESDYARIESVPSKRFGKLNLLRLHPQTGRRHQLRIQLSGLGNPILGDCDYGIKDLILNKKGVYLHAYSLAFTHPFTNEKISVRAGLPSRFKKIFSQAKPN